MRSLYGWSVAALGLVAAVALIDPAKAFQPAPKPQKDAEVQDLVITSSRPRPRPFEPCVLPKPRKGDLVVLLGAYEGAALSDVTVAGQDAATHVATINVEPGRRPIYLLASSFSPMVWRFTGDTRRIRRLVLTGPMLRPSPTVQVMELGGATGIAEDRISARSPWSCFHSFSDPRSAGAKAAAEQVRQVIGRAPDVIAAAYEIDVMQLPSGRAPPLRTDWRHPPSPPAGFDREAWSDVISFNPGGVVRIDPAAVKGPVKAVRYEVMPNQAGLAQLVYNGYLTRTPNGYRVVRPIPRLPAAMHGGHSTTLTLARGVPMPPGDPGHSCIISEETGEAVGAVCVRPRRP